MIAFLSEFAFAALIMILTGLLIVGIIWLMFYLFGPKKEEKKEVPVDPLEKALADVKTRLGEMVELRKALDQQETAIQNQITETTLRLTKWQTLAGMATTSEAKETASRNIVSSDAELKSHKERLAQVSKRVAEVCTTITEFETLIVKARGDKDFLEAALKVNKFSAELGEVFNPDGKTMGALEKLRQEVQVTEYEAKLARGETINFNREQS